MAEWYRGLATKAAMGGKIVALGRSIAYYKEFLRVHDRKDVPRVTAEAQLKAVIATAAGLKLHLADRIVLLNTHNGPNADRGSVSVNVLVMRESTVIWRKSNCALAWSPTEDAPTELALPNLLFTKVRVEVTKWRGLGGGLTEVQVMERETNIAKGGRVAASAAFDNTFAPGGVVDGVLTSEKVGGFWLLPTNQPGWIEVTPSGGASAGTK